MSASGVEEFEAADDLTLLEGMARAARLGLPVAVHAESEALTASASPLSTSAWSSSTTPPALGLNASRPGEAKVYPGEVGEWQVPVSALKKAAGTYRLQCSARYAEGSRAGREQDAGTAGAAGHDGQADVAGHALVEHVPGVETEPGPHLEGSTEAVEEQANIELHQASRVTVPGHISIQPHHGHPFL